MDSKLPDRDETYLVLRTIACRAQGATVSEITRSAQCSSRTVEAEVAALSKLGHITLDSTHGCWKITENVSPALRDLAESTAQKWFIAKQNREVSKIDIAARLEWIDDMLEMILHAKGTLDETLPKA